MAKKWIFFIISVAAIAAFLGCHAGGNSPLAPNNGETVVSPEIRIVDANGRFTDITFPSGAVIKCPNDSTFQEGVKVTAAEQKVPVITDNSGKFSYIYVYNISSVLPSDNTLTADVPVNTIEKPLKVSIPNNSTTGICYIGTRASESDPWRYTLADDGGVGNLRYSRLSITSPKVCYFDIYRLNIQFRLFVFDNEDSDKAEVDFVDVSTGSKENKISIENGKYTEDLEIKISLYGEKLDSIHADNLAARIIYRSKNLSPAKLKTNGSIVKQNDSDDKAVTGGYEHSFEINDIKIDSSMSGEAVISFVLNLNGISLEDFPTDFLVEFYSDTKDEKALPFIYTRAFSFETVEKQKEQEEQEQQEQQDDPQPQLDTFTITLDPNGGTLDNTTIEYTAETDDFNLPTPTKTGYTFLGWTGTGLDNATTQVTIEKGSTGNRTYTANWLQNAPDEYTLTLIAGTGIASVGESKAYKADESIELNYTLKEGYEFDKWSNSKGNEVASPFTMPAEDVALTANAKAITYNITYNLDNGQLTKDNPENYTVETESFTLNNPTKDHYKFDGWVINGGEPIETVTITKGTHENRKYTAKFTPATFTVTLVPNGGTIDYTSIDYNIETADFTLPTPTRTGYEFLGWILEGETTPVMTVKIAKGSNGAKKYTANWKLNLTLTIAANANSIIEGDLYDCNASFTITPTLETGAVITDTEKANILAALCVKDSQSTSLSNLTSNWNNEGKIDLTFDTATLTASISYAIDFGEIEGVNLTCEPLTFKTFYYKGRGVEANPYLVENVEQLRLVESYPSCHFKQTADIDLSGITKWVALCAQRSNKHFTGVYDGNSKKVKNLKIQSSEFMENVGLFDNLENGAQIKNLTVDGFSIRGASENTPLNARNVGIIAVNVNTGCSIIGCHLTDSSATTATDSSSIINVLNDNNNYYDPNNNYSHYVGGICNINYGTISDCSVEKCQIKCSGDVANSISFGGICKENRNIVENCSLEETIIDCSVNSLDNYVHIGGICNNNFGTLTFCHVKNSSISSLGVNHGTLWLAGICNWHNSNMSLSSCYVQNSRVSGNSESATQVGGIATTCDGNSSISSCHVIEGSLIEGTGNNCYVGGIGAYNFKISDCYVNGSTITADGKEEGCTLGGIAGGVYGTQSISNCYISNTEVKGISNSSGIGGIVGNGVNISNCYADASTISGEGDNLCIGGIGGCGYIISKCYVAGADIRITTTGNGGGYISGICGLTRGSVTSSYLYNSNVTGSGKSNEYIAGISGYCDIGSSIETCYVYEDDFHSISKNNGSGYLGYLVGLLYKYDSNPDSNAKVTDSFCNIATPNGLSDLVNAVGSESSSSAPPNDYGYVTNCYGGITDLSTFSGKTWSDGAWSDFNTSSFPPTLNQN